MAQEYKIKKRKAILTEELPPLLRNERPRPWRKLL